LLGIGAGHECALVLELVLRVQLRDALEPHFSDLSDEDWDAIARTARILAVKTAPRVDVAR